MRKRIFISLIVFTFVSISATFIYAQTPAPQITSIEPFSACGARINFNSTIIGTYDFQVSTASGFPSGANTISFTVNNDNGTPIVGSGAIIATSTSARVSYLNQKFYNPNTQYWFRVKVIPSSGASESVFSVAQGQTTAVLQDVGAPQNIQGAWADAGYKIQISWARGAPTPSKFDAYGGFEIYRASSNDGGNTYSAFSLAERVPATLSNYDDNARGAGLNSNLSYKYKVHAYQSDFECQLGDKYATENPNQLKLSPVSMEIISPARPSNLAATVTADKKIKLEWQDNSSGAGNEDKFEIWKKFESNPFVKLVDMPSGATNYKDSNIQEGKNYAYKVRACHLSGPCSVFTPEVSLMVGVVGTDFSTAGIVYASAQYATLYFEWGPNVNYFYTVERKELPSGNYQAVCGEGKISFCTNTNVPVGIGKSYLYRLKSRNGNDITYSTEAPFNLNVIPVSGAAWSAYKSPSGQSGVGWISLNSDTPLPSGGVHSPTVRYSIQIDSDGLLSGAGWGHIQIIGSDEHGYGWLSFNKSDLTRCLSGPCEARLGSEGKINGWARFLGPKNNPVLKAWDGWVSLRGFTTENPPNEYGICFGSSTGDEAAADGKKYMTGKTCNNDGPAKKDVLSGVAWAGPIVGGWLAFSTSTADIIPPSIFSIKPDGPHRLAIRESKQFSIIETTPPYGSVAAKWGVKPKKGDDSSIVWGGNQTLGSVSPVLTAKNENTTYTAPNSEISAILIATSTESDTSKQGRAETDIEVVAPYEFSCVTQGKTSIKLVWSKNYKDVFNYPTHQLKLFGGALNPPTQVLKGYWNPKVDSTTSFVHDNLSSSTAYYYALETSYTSDDAFKKTVSAVCTTSGDTGLTITDAPTKLSAFGHSSNKIYVNWKDNTTTIQPYSFQVQRIKVTPAIATNFRASFTTNQSPTVFITAPSNNSSFSAGSFLTIAASASDSDGTITKVEFYRDSTKLGEDTSSPYAYAWLNLPAGSYTLTAKATDNSGAQTTSGGVAITITTSAILSASLSATPNTGTAPLTGVDLSASVGGTATGNINYTFYCNRSDTGTNITTPYSHKLDNTSLTTYTVSNLCSYTNSGTYTAKVIVERDSFAAEAQQTIQVLSIATCSDGIMNQDEADVDCGGPCPACAATGDVAIVNQRWESSLTSSKAYNNPYMDVKVGVEYAGPQGQKFYSYGFWDGGSIFKIRNSFPSAGVWTWKTNSTDTSDSGLNNKQGIVTVSAYAGSNKLYQKGYLKVSSNNRYLTYGDGTPFLWVGDTAWVAPLGATYEEWKIYVDDRVAKNFTVIQISPATRWGGSQDRYGNAAFLDNGGLTSNKWNPSYWQEYDRKVQYANDKGIVVVIVGIMEPVERYPSADNAKLFARNIAARLYGNFVILSPSFDTWDSGYFSIADSVGYELDKTTSRHLITQHPGTPYHPATNTIAEYYYGKSYMDFTGMQTGHNSGDRAWCVWKAINYNLAAYQKTPISPVINMEAFYDGYHDDGFVTTGTDLDARSLGYLSMLSGAAGYTYGAEGLENWETNSGLSTYWINAMQYPSSNHMKHFYNFFNSIEWHNLQPSPSSIKNQPADNSQLMGFAKSADGKLGVAYLHKTSSIRLDMSVFSGAVNAQWYNPRTGVYTDISGTFANSGEYTFTRPDSNDWVLYLKKSSTDTQKPTISSFDVQPRTATNNSVTASWAASDNTALQKIEIYRANDTGGSPGTWTLINTKTVSGTTNTGTYTDSPGNGTWWYGIHATDTSNNVTHEPLPPGPIKVVVGISTSQNPISFSIDEVPRYEQFFAFEAGNGGNREITFRSKEKIYVYSLDGTKLWSKNLKTPFYSITPEYGSLESATHGASDIDNDGAIEIVALSNDGKVYIMNALTGVLEKTITLPTVGSGNFWSNLAVANLRGQGDTDLVLSTANSISTTNPDNFINRNLLAWDVRNNVELWRVLQDTDPYNDMYEGYWGQGHGPFRIADVDNDGRDEVVGGNMIDHNGAIIDVGYDKWARLPEGGYPDHIDAISIGDFRPDIPGLEWVVPEEGWRTYNFKTAMLSTSGMLWRKDTQVFSGYLDEPQNIAVGNFDTSKPCCQVWARSRLPDDGSGVPNGQHPWVFDRYGNEFADYEMANVLPSGFNTHASGNREGIEMIFTIDWDGSGKNYLAAKARHVNGNIIIMDAITAEPVFYTPRDSAATQASLIYVADVLGDAREEMIIYDIQDSKIKVYWNPVNSVNTPVNKWDKNYYKRTKQNWNYYSP